MTTEAGVNGNAGNEGQNTKAEIGKEGQNKGGQQTQQTFDEFIASNKEEFEKRLNSHADKRVTDAIKTHDEKRLATEAEKQAKIDAEKKKLEDDKNLSDDQKKISSLEEKLGTVTDMFEKFMGKSDTEKLSTAKEEALKAAGLPITLAKRMTAKDVDSIAADVEELKKEFQDIRQKEIDAAIEKKKKPVMGLSDSAGTADKQIKTYIDNKAKSSAGAASEQINKG